MSENNIRKVISRYYWIARGWFRKYFTHVHDCLYEKQITEIPDHPQFEMVLFKEFDEKIIEVHKALDLETNEELLRTRFKNGMYFYYLLEGEQIVGTHWYINGHHMFVNEIGLYFDFPEHAFVPKDIYVPPYARGRRIFGILYDVLLKDLSGKKNHVHLSGQNQHFFGKSP